MIKEKTPTRIDLAGGTLDIWPLSVMFAPSVSINAAIDLYATVEARETPGLETPVIKTGDGKIIVYSADTPEKKKTLFHRALDFVPVGGWEFTVRTDSPTGAGLGGSSSMLIAFLRAANRIKGGLLSNREILDAAKNIEARHLGIPTGVQDYIAAINGGVNAIIHEKEFRECRMLDPKPGELERRVVLAYSGASRNSGTPNWNMIKKAVEKDKKTTDAFWKIAGNSLDILYALAGEKFDAIGRLIDKESKQREKLARGIVTPAIKKVFSAVSKKGGHPKVCGAGGGGCFLVWCQPDDKAAVKKIVENAGMKTLDFKVAPVDPDKL
jgi:D-glycero-alpha-D-manno-heptose-7-phosphate kinase